MPVSFDDLIPGQAYERPELAKIWGYAGYQAISRGVITPAQSQFIILFVTEQKQASLTQYQDRLEDHLLHWEGEEKHATDKRIIDASSHGDEIHLFHRKVHHSPFIYLGQVVLEEHAIRQDSPSQFIFSLIANTSPHQHTIGDEIREPIDTFGILETERNALAKSRNGQGVYRDGLFRLWGRCAVTKYERASLLVASHIKPWRASTNRERLDPYNGLLLQPTLNSLFDKGLISFENNGGLIRSISLETDELVTLGVDPKAHLWKIPEPTKLYLKYHRDHEFERLVG